MAGDWMKIELELPDKPEVHKMAGILGIDPDAVVGKLIRVWQWFDKHTIDGHADGVTYSLLDRATFVTGFAEAMFLVGWLDQNGQVLIMPNFDRHNGKGAKTRCLTGIRKQKERSRSQRDKSVTREEKRRVKEKDKKERKPFIPPTLIQVTEYALSRGNIINPKTFFDYFEAGDWKDKDGKQVKSWKQKYISWESRENKSNPEEQKPYAQGAI